MRFVDLGLIKLPEALRRQQETVLRIAAQDGPETVYLLEHPHVFTTGRLGEEENLLAKSDWNGTSIEPISINRGGDVTYHGPGQLVGYLHLDLRRRHRDVHLFLRNLESSLIRTVKRLGVRAFRRQGLTGVWSDQGKLASIGVGVSRWITMHGFALNIHTDLRYFQLINPCGLTNCPMTSLSRLLDRRVSMCEVKGLFQKCFQETFRN